MGFISFHLSPFSGRICTLLPAQTHKGFPKQKALYFITSALQTALRSRHSLHARNLLIRPFIGWSATVVITLGRSRMGSSCPLLSSPTGNDPAFPKLAFLARSHAGGLGASFGSAITESLLPEKAIRLSRNTVPPGSNCYRFWQGKGLLVWKVLHFTTDIFCSKRRCLSRKNFALHITQRTFFQRLSMKYQKKFLTLQRTISVKNLSLAAAPSLCRHRESLFVRIALKYF